MTTAYRIEKVFTNHDYEPYPRQRDKEVAAMLAANNISFHTYKDRVIFEKTKKFDPELKYIRKWVPGFEEFSYPAPIVEHEFARKRCLEAYSNALKK